MSLLGRFHGPEQNTDPVRDLMRVLSRQEEICQALLKVSDQERQAAIESKLQLLEQLGREKGDLIEKLGALESERQRISGKVAAGIGLPATATLAEIASHMDDPDGCDLRSVRERLVDLAARLQKSNTTNLMFMRKSLDLVRDSIRQLRRSMGSGAYGADGNLVTRAQPVLSASVAVDRRA